MARILVAEDDDLTRYLLQLTLEQHGHTVDTVSNGREAIQTVIANPPDLIMLDLIMPGLDGMDVIRTVRDVPEYEAIRIIVVTGTATPENFPETTEADLVLHKPIPIDELVEQIEGLL
ncbi:MAG: response regulator [Chloroflexota bacterium]